MSHYIESTPGGAQCSCGKTFSVWAAKQRPGWAASNPRDLQRGINLARGNAGKHAVGANKRERKVTEVTPDGLGSDPTGRV